MCVCGGNKIDRKDIRFKIEPINFNMFLNT